MKVPVLMFAILIFCGCITQTEQINSTTTTIVVYGIPTPQIHETPNYKIGSVDYQKGSNDTFVIYSTATAIVPQNLSPIKLDRTIIEVKTNLETIRYFYGGRGNCSDIDGNDNLFYLNVNGLTDSTAQESLYDGDRLHICWAATITDKNIKIRFLPHVGKPSEIDLELNGGGS